VYVKQQPVDVEVVPEKGAYQVGVAVDERECMKSKEEDTPIHCKCALPNRNPYHVSSRYHEPYISSSFLLKP
jgi:hypothetical protein